MNNQLSIDGIIFVSIYFISLIWFSCAFTSMMFKYFYWSLYLLYVDFRNYQIIVILAINMIYWMEEATFSRIFCSWRTWIALYNAKFTSGLPLWIWTRACLISSANKSWVWPSITTELITLNNIKLWSLNWTYEQTREIFGNRHQILRTAAEGIVRQPTKCICWHLRIGFGIMFFWNCLTAWKPSIW